MSAPLSKTFPTNASPPAASVTLRRLAIYARPYLWLIGLALVCSLVFAGGRFGRALLMKPLLDDVLMPYQAVSTETSDWLPDLGFGTATPLPDAVEPKSPSQLDEKEKRDQAVMAQVGENFAFIVKVALVIVVILPLALFARTYLMAYAMGRVGVDIQRSLAAKLLALPLSFHHNTSGGDTLTRALRDAENSQLGLELFFFEFLQATIMITFGVASLLYISWQLSLVSLVVVPAIVSILAVFGRKVHIKARLRQEQVGEVTQRLLSILSGIKVIKAFRGETLEDSAFGVQAEKLFRRNLKVVINRGIATSLVETLNAGVAIGMIVLGSLMVLQGRFGLTSGDVAAFALALATTYQPVKRISRDWTLLTERLASAERFLALLDLRAESPDPVDAVVLEEIEREIVFDDVHFSYGREPVLKGVSLRVVPGEVIAVVGRTGSGKSTLVDLLLRFHDVQSGSISIDGTDLRQIQRASLLDRIAIVSQEAFLFDTTIFENIRYGRPDASRDEILAAASAAHVDEFVGQLPQGFDTPVGEFGLQLSGGQRQRITIARALLKDPQILICDEATSALDAKTERTVQEAIDRLRGRRTVFVVAHRLSTIRGADRIVVLEDGRISEAGSHDELMQRGGYYSELVSIQVASDGDEGRARG